MVKGTIIHPQILAAVAACGHGDKVLIADGNYPLASKTGTAEKVYLGLKPGCPTVPDVLAALQTIINIEKAEVMDPGDGITPDIFEVFQTMLANTPISKHNRNEFYEECEKAAVRLAISTGERRVFANILITVGVA